jgi:hypothetical protein
LAAAFFAAPTNRKAGRSLTENPEGQDSAQNRDAVFFRGLAGLLSFFPAKMAI